ncbi:MAG: hypothetical protein GC168_08145 [Candidatus Hydrogenedens sp.]|nr:hypothetical protein [Candidatus Hydrogenedens sp.]
MIDQAFGLLRLQYLLAWRTWTRGRTLAAAAAFAFGIVGTGVVSVVCAGLFLLGANGLKGESSYLQLLLFNAMIAAYAVVWVWSFLIEIQRQDVFDQRKLLHFPVPPGLVFGMNFVSSLLTPTLLAAVPCGIALVAGMTFAYGPHVAMAAAHALAFFFMLGAWQYHLRGWLSILFENKRKRRALMTVVAIATILLAQTPALLTLNGGKDVKAWMDPILKDPALEPALLDLDRFVPLGWLALGARAVIERDGFTAAWTFAGMTGLGVLGVLWGYRSTLRFYLGAGNARAGAAAKRRRAGRPLTARLLPPLAEDTAALAYAQLLAYGRHPQVRMQLFMPPILGLVLVMVSRSGDADGLRAFGTLGVVPTAVLFMPFANFSMLLFNLFGIDPRGFRGLMLLPVPRTRTLLAKNLALAPFVCGTGFGMLAVSGLLLDIGWRTAALLALLIPQLYIAYCIAGNFLSVAYPYHLSRDTMRSQGDRLVLFFVGLASVFFTFVLCLPAGLILLVNLAGMPGWPESLPEPAFVMALALLGVTAGTYALTLVHTGDWLTTREQRILGKLMKDKN